MTQAWETWSDGAKEGEAAAKAKCDSDEFLWEGGRRKGEGYHGACEVWP